MRQEAPRNLAYRLRERDELAPVAVGMRFTSRLPQSGRVEAQTGFQMMPTFPRPSLSFRTVGFRRCVDMVNELKGQN
jgi:hypothetical protein